MKVRGDDLSTQIGNRHILVIDGDPTLSLGDQLPMAFNGHIIFVSQPGKIWNGPEGLPC